MSNRRSSIQCYHWSPREARTHGISAGTNSDAMKKESADAVLRRESPARFWTLMVFFTAVPSGEKINCIAMRQPLISGDNVMSYIGLQKKWAAGKISLDKMAASVIFAPLY
jgi:hypothetical protein